MKERVEWIAMMHKQNLNGRETEDELFEAGILAGIEETEAIMYREEEVLDLLYKIRLHNPDDIVEWFEQFKK